jgi:hypothetical protein
MSQRQRHGSPAVWHHLVHIALRFVKLGASGADVECLMSIRTRLQGPNGTNSWPDTMNARLIMHDMPYKQSLIG